MQIKSITEYSKVYNSYYLNQLFISFPLRSTISEIFNSEKLEA